MNKFSFALALAIAISGCTTSTGIIPVENGTLMLSKTGTKVGGGLLVELHSEVANEAEAYCAQQGKALEVVQWREVPNTIGAAGTESLQFRCVAKA